MSDLQLSLSLRFIVKSKQEENRDYYLRNAERIKAQNSIWAAANLEKRRAYDRKRRIRNPEHVRALARGRELNRRARKRNAFVESVNPLVVFQRDAGICKICCLPIAGSQWHIDHKIPLVAGGEHSYANVQLSHASCNLKKGAKVSI